MVSKRLLRVPSIFLNLRSFNSTSFSATALLSSSRLKKVWFLRAANIHISAIFTAVSTFALSFGFLTRAGIIDKEFFPGPVGLSKADIQFACPLAITIAELAVLISTGIAFLVFRPEKLEGNPFLFQFLVKVLHGRHNPLICVYMCGRRKQQTFHGGIVKIVGQRPGKPLELCSIQIIFDGAPGNVTTLGNLTFGEPFLQLQSQYFIYFAHG